MDWLLERLIDRRDRGLLVASGDGLPERLLEGLLEGLVEELLEGPAEGLLEGVTEGVFDWGVLFVGSS